MSDDTRYKLSRAALFAGYGLAVPETLEVGRIIPRGDTAAFVRLETGTALSFTGWVLQGVKRGIIVNGAAFVGFAVWWGAMRRND